jgi:hypothetical protein
MASDEGGSMLPWLIGGGILLYYLYSSGALSGASAAASTPVYNPSTGQWQDPATGAVVAPPADQAGLAYGTTAPVYGQSPAYSPATPPYAYSAPYGGYNGYRPGYLWDGRGRRWTPPKRTLRRRGAVSSTTGLPVFYAGGYTVDASGRILTQTV